MHSYIIILYILLVSLTELHYSQINSIKITTKTGFRDLQNYTTLKQRSNRMKYTVRFRDLQNYTTLKRQAPFEFVPVGFRDLQNYTTLKRGTH